MSQTWYAKRGDLEFGPWSGQQLKAAAASGVLRLDDSVRTAGKNKWVRAGDVKGLMFGTIPVQPEPIHALNSSQPTSPERRQPPPSPTKSKSGPPPLPTPTQTPLRLPVKAQKPVMLVGVCTLGLLLVCGFGVLVTEGRKSPTVGDDTGRVTAADSSRDICEDDLRGIFNGMTDENFQNIIGKLGRPTLSGRQMPAPRFSCQYMAAWKKKDGLYLYLWWLESTDPRNGSKSIANFRTWDNQTLGQVETNWKMISK